MNRIIEPGRLQGVTPAPPSKSAAHRLAICAALSQGESRITGAAPTQDMLATMDAAGALGAACRLEEGVLSIRGIHSPPPAATVDCNESGSTFRFFVPIAAALGVETAFHGKGKLPQRPMKPLTKAMEANGAVFSRRGGEILTVSGRLNSGEYRLPGNVSSQYITGLLFALPLLQGESRIRLTSPLESRGYVDMTLQALEDAGITVAEQADGFLIPGGQQYRSQGEQRVEGDYSGAAFLLCAGAIGSDLTVTNLRADSLQGDWAVVSILERMGATVRREDGQVSCGPGRLEATDVDISQIPDLAPILAVTAAYAQGTSRLYNAGRLRLKESDRLESITAGLKALGADISIQGDSLSITGKQSLAGGCPVDSYGDHRIAMAMAIAALGCQAPVTILDAECAEKSYTGFYRVLEELGGVCHAV